MKLDRSTLKIIRNMAYDLAAHSGMAPNWKQAYIDLSSAADRLDAMLARNRVTDQRFFDLPPTIPWDPSNAIVFIPEGENGELSIEDRIKEHFEKVRKLNPLGFQIVGLEQEELYGRALKLADQISTSPSRLSFEVVDPKTARIFARFLNKSHLEATLIPVIPPVLRPEGIFHIRVVRLLLEEDEVLT